MSSQPSAPFEGPQTVRSILYLEDEILVALDGADMMADAGYDDVTMVHDIDAAIAAANERHFDVAVLDINLGDGRTSLPLARMLAERGTRIIFASGYNNCIELTGGISAQVINKPIDPRILARVLDGGR